MIGDMLSRFRWVLLLIGCSLITSCGGPTPTVIPPTPLPNLNASLWMDFPTLRAGQAQAANLAITDPSGQPVAGITAVLVISSGSYQQQYRFPVTGNDGMTRVAVELPPITGKTTFTVEVVAVDSKGGTDKAVSTFDLYP